MHWWRSFRARHRILMLLSSSKFFMNISDEKRYKIQGRAMTLTLAVADIVILNCHLHDLFRDVAAVFAPVAAAITELKRLEKEKLVSQRTSKAPLLVLARDFDAGMRPSAVTFLKRSCSETSHQVVYPFF